MGVGDGNFMLGSVHCSLQASAEHPPSTKVLERRLKKTQEDSSWPLGPHMSNECVKKKKIGKKTLILTEAVAIQVLGLAEVGVKVDDGVSC